MTTQPAENGVLYADFVAAEVTAAQAMLDSIRDRGGRLLQMTLGVLTALAAASGFNAGLGGIWATPWFLGGAVLCLAVSAVCFLLVVKPVTHQRVTTATLTAMLTDHWADSALDSRHAIATSNINTLEQLRTNTTRQAKRLTVGIVAQSAGVLLGFAAFVIAAMS